MPAKDPDRYTWITVGDYERAIREGRAKRMTEPWFVKLFGPDFYSVPEFTPGIFRGLKIVIKEED